MTPNKRLPVLWLLRITASTVCLAVCAILLVLWLRSYERLDAVRGHFFSLMTIRAASRNGRLVFSILPAVTAPNWSLNSVTDTQIEKVMQQDPQLQVLLQQQVYIQMAMFSDRETSRNVRDTSRGEREFRHVTRQIELYRAQALQDVLAKMGFPQITGYFGFGFQRLANDCVVACPHWFSILISGVMAAFFGTRRMWRFSLRTLLFATTVVAFVLGTLAMTR
jgi:hypothetical protein